MVYQYINFSFLLFSFLFFFFFFWEMDPRWNPRNHTHWPIALYLSFKFIGCYLGVQPPLPRAMISLSLASFICSGSILVKPKVCILTFSNAGHSRRMCTYVSFLHRISCMRKSLLSSPCAACTADWYARFGALPTFCNVSCTVNFLLDPGFSLSWNLRLYETWCHRTGSLPYKRKSEETRTIFGLKRILTPANFDG